MATLTSPRAQAKPIIPYSKLPASLQRKRNRVNSQRTLDTHTALPQQQKDLQNVLHEQELNNEIANVSLVLKKAQSQLRYSHLPKPTPLLSIQYQNHTIQLKDKQIAELRAEIQRLKDVYNRNKQPVSDKQLPSTAYSQQHLANNKFTLTAQIQKQRKHMQLHMEHHRSLATKASEMYRNIQGVMEKYVAHQKGKGRKVVTYEEYRRRELLKKKEVQAQNQRKRSLSNRSGRSRANSVRDIVEGRAECMQVIRPKNAYQMQRRKSIAMKAKDAAERKNERQRGQLLNKIHFLKDEDDMLQMKIHELLAEVGQLEGALGTEYYTFNHGSGKSAQSTK